MSGSSAEAKAVLDWVADLTDFGAADVAVVGGKAANLGELFHAGVPVPPGFVVQTSAYQLFVAANDLQDRILAAVPNGPEAEPATYELAAREIAELFDHASFPSELAEQINACYRHLGGDPGSVAEAAAGVAVAVRSSATAEDLAGASFAGQQDTYLNVIGTDALLTAVRHCWASLWTARAIAYRARQEIDPADVSLAVVVQQLVAATSAGVMFTADPGTGNRETVLISAAWGLGEAVVGGLVNTDQLTLTGVPPAVSQRETADKAVQTIRAETGTVEVEVPAELRRTDVLSDAAAGELAGLGLRIAGHFGTPQDVEWARDESGTFWIVQSRPITALPAPTGPVPTEWPLPNPDAWYFRASIVEQLPDPLTPLFAELIGPAVTDSLTGLMREMTGPGVLRAGDIAFPTINGYAYYAYSRSSLGRMLRSTPKALVNVYGKRQLGGQRYWETTARPAYQAAVTAWKTRTLTALTPTELLDGVAALLLAGATYYTSVQTIIPLAATAEIALTRYYDAFIRRDGDPAAASLLLGFDSQPIRAERSLWDLARWAGQQPALADWLRATPANEIASALRVGPGPDSGPEIALLDDFASRFQQHLDAYGHSVYTLDFANPVAADDPAPLLDTIRIYLAGRAADPYERQRQLQHKRDAATVVIRRRIDPVRRSGFDSLLRRAQAIAPIREDALADIGLAWPQLRQLLAELGRRLVAAGSVTERDDVYWCLRAEIETALNPMAGGYRNGTAGSSQPERALGETPTLDLRDSVERRKQTVRGQRRATPPQLLPQGTWMDRMGSMMPATMAEQTGDSLAGVAASAGRVSAIARVLSGPEDFSRLQPGEILVASITTPAWTPLFSRAAGVVTDIGGPLSHSSIVAREYGIPAVLGTAVATRRIIDGQQITVDGDSGKVYLTGADQLGPARPAHRRLNRWLIAGGSLAAAAASGVAAVAVRRSHRAESAPRP